VTTPNDSESGEQEEEVESLPSLSPEFNQLVITHQSSLYAFIQSLVPGDSSVDDILQETNITLCAKEANFEKGSNFKAFAFSVARFKVLSHLRDKKRHQWLLADSDLCEELTENMIQQPVSQAPAQDHLRRCLNNLPDQQRQLMEKRYREGYSLRELSKIHKRTEGSLQQLFHRLRKLLRECIEKSMAIKSS
jgi:RNA polymerase sigma-70 factor (ECF subfamily)